MLIGDSKLLEEEREVSPLGIAGKLRVGLEAISVGKRFDDPENSQPVDGYVLLNLRFQYQRNLRENYFVSLMNLAGRDYENFAGFPQSGRTLVAGVDYRY